MQPDDIIEPYLAPISTEPLTHLKVMPFAPIAHQTIKDLLAQRGCTCQERSDHWLLTFPEGTTRHEYWPRTRCERFLITLPDGYTLYEIQSITHPLHTLGFHSEGFPPEIQAAAFQLDGDLSSYDEEHMSHYD